MKALSSISILSILAAASLSAVAADTDKPQAGKDPMVQELAGRKGPEFDNAFLAHMIHHHQGGIQMGELALEKAKEPEIKKMMQKSITMQKEEIAQMTGWLKEWGNKTPDDYPMPEASKKQMQEDMVKLKDEKGTEFDEMFLKQMMHHHHSAIAMSELALKSSEKKELKEFAEKLIKTQKKEIGQMEKLKS